MITILLMNYRRRENISVILDTLRSQTIPCEIFLWNNAEEPFDDKRVDWVINSSKNTRCWPRWFVGQFASNDFIMSLDDDLNFTDSRCLEILMQEVQEKYEEGRAFGFFGVQLDGGKTYFPTKNERKLKSWGLKRKVNRHVSFPGENTPVDIIKGRCLLCHKDDLDKVPIKPKHTDFGDDIIMSYYLAEGKNRHHIVTNKLNGMVEDLWGRKKEMALSEKNDWNETRTRIMNTYFGASDK